MRLLRILPAPLHRLVLRNGDRLRKAWWKRRRPELHGCLIIAFDDEGRVMLVRHSYGTGYWGFPTGGLARGEQPEEGARREFTEETGAAIGQLRKLTVVHEEYYGTHHTQHVFVGQAEDGARADGREIVALDFFPRDALPRPISRKVKRLLAMLEA